MPALQKYYFDVVSDNGDYAIAYWGTLRLPVLSATYSELSGSALPEPYSRFRVSRTDSPPDHRRFEFVDANSKVRAKWVAIGQSPRLFYENDLLRWELVQLRSQVALYRDAAPLLAGSGYGELVTLLVPPWRLGIRKLRWGRYLSDRAFLMWIVAEGETPIRYGVVDQSQFDDVTFAEGEVKIGDATLQIGTKIRVVSEGDVLGGRSLFLGALSFLVFGDRPRIKQSKAVSKCNLRRGSGLLENGHIISETVWFEP